MRNLILVTDGNSLNFSKEELDVMVTALNVNGKMDSEGSIGGVLPIFTGVSTGQDLAIIGEYRPDTIIYWGGYDLTPYAIVEWPGLSGQVLYVFIPNNPDLQDLSDCLDRFEELL